MSARTRARPPSIVQELAILAELDRLGNTAERLRAANPSTNVREFVQVILARVMRQPPPATTSDANRRIDFIRADCRRLLHAMPHRGNPADLSRDLEAALADSVSLQARAERGESIDTAASVRARYLVAVRAARLGGSAEPNIPQCG